MRICLYFHVKIIDIYIKFRQKSNMITPPYSFKGHPQFPMNPSPTYHYFAYIYTFKAISALFERVRWPYEPKQPTHPIIRASSPLSLIVNLQYNSVDYILLNHHRISKRYPRIIYTRTMFAIRSRFLTTHADLWCMLFSRREHAQQQQRRKCRISSS